MRAGRPPSRKATDQHDPGPRPATPLYGTTSRQDLNPSVVPTFAAHDVARGAGEAGLRGVTSR